MNLIEQQQLTGERALFKCEDTLINQSVFENGESPLKESRNIKVENSTFKWKYPLWYCKDVEVNNSALLDMARSGIWYTDNITINDSIIEAPKTFRQGKQIALNNVFMSNAAETLWSCKDIKINNVNAKGDYFAMNSSNIVIDRFNLDGNYPFECCKNIEIHNAKMLSKDAFWNCENVTVYDSVITGEYLGWNSKNLTFINCTIESLQGLCYIENLVMKNCNLINTTLAFEYSTVDVQINTTIESVFNPTSGTIKAKGIKELILDKTKVNPNATNIILEDN